MPNNNDNRKLLLYVSVSIVLHLLILYFLPIGFLHGSAQSKNELNDYGYVQMVDYQPAPLAEKNIAEDAKLTEEPATKKQEEIKKETKKETKPDKEQKTEVKKTKSEPENTETPKPESEPVVKEQQQKPEIKEKPASENAVDNSEVVKKEKPASETEPIKQENKSKPVEKDVKPKSETESKPEPEPEPDSSSEKTDLMASKESKSKLEVVQKESQKNEKIEESQKDTEVKSEQSQEKIKETGKESSQNTEAKVKEESQADQKAVKATQTEDNTTDNSKEQQVEKVNPPPPPTSGDLIGLIEPPTFPKDLVGSRSEGTVKLMVELSPGGNIKAIDVVDSSGYDSMDRVAKLTLEHGWEFKEYQRSYRIPVSIRYYIDESDNSQVEVDIGQVEFISGGE